MSSQTYRYQFPQPVDMGQVQDTLVLATLAAEGLHGRSRVQLEANFRCDAKSRTAEVEADSEVGSAIARIFTALLATTLGERAFHVARPAEVAA